MPPFHSKRFERYDFVVFLAHTDADRDCTHGAIAVIDRYPNGGIVVHSSFADQLADRQVVLGGGV